MSKNIFKNKNSLEKALDNPDYEDVFNDMFFNMYDINPDGLCEAPYWIEKYYMDDNYAVEYQRGYYEPLELGTIKEYPNNYHPYENIMWRYIDTQRLDEEVEHQADDGSLIYEYRGYSYLRIWQKVNKE